MNGWCDDFATLLLKRGLLLKEQAADAVRGYLNFLAKASTLIGLPVAGLTLLLFLSSLIGIQAGWLYQILILLIAIGLVALSVIWLPLLISAEAVMNAMPGGVRATAGRWTRRIGAILFGALVIIIFVRVFRLWRAPAVMVTVTLVLAALTMGGYFGWLVVSPLWRKSVGVALQVTLLVLLVAALLPGPAGLVEELATWGEQRLEGSIYDVTRDQADWWEPESADDLIFVDRQSGRFLIWYHKDAAGNYRLARSRGFDEYGRPLEVADTEAEVRAIREWQLSKDRQRAATEQERREADARRDQEEKLAAEQREKEEADKREQRRVQAVEREKARIEKAERERIASYIVSLPSDRVDYVVFCIEADGQSANDVSSTIARSLDRQAGVDAVDDVFSLAFATDDGYGQMVAGRGRAVLEATKLGEVASKLLLLRMGKAQSSASNRVEGLYSYSAPITIHIIDAADGRKLQQVEISDVTGIGMSTGAARSAFIERLAEQILNRI